MPASKTAPLEKRITKLEQELAAYKRQLSKQAPGENASARELARLRRAVFRMFDAAVDIDWESSPELAKAADELAEIARTPDPVTPTPNKRTPR